AVARGRYELRKGLWAWRGSTFAGGVRDGTILRGPGANVRGARRAGAAVVCFFGGTGGRWRAAVRACGVRDRALNAGRREVTDVRSGQRLAMASDNVVRTATEMVQVGGGDEPAERCCLPGD